MTFNEATDILWKRTGSHGVMILSTCADNRVTSRAVSVVVINGKFYCQTNRNYLKCRQLLINPNASLCFGNISIEGNCKIIGKPCENDFFLKAMHEHFPDAVKRWSALPEECVIELIPRIAASWVYENDIPFMEYWDFDNLEYRKERQ